MTHSSKKEPGVISDEQLRPAEAGYRWPAEWEPHEATWLAWPHNAETWPGIMPRIAPAFTALVRCLASFEPVRVLAGGEKTWAEAERWIGKLANVTLLDIETNDAWVRDYGPQFLLPIEGGFTALVDWQFNSWGQKYPPWDKDNSVSRHVAESLNCRRWTPGLVLEGGGIEGNGQGTLMTTRGCLSSPRRNPTISAEIIERYLRSYACADHVVWLDIDGLAGDDTDGHIDQLVRFVDETTVVCAVAGDGSDENHAPLEAAHEQLSRVTVADGRLLRVVRLPLPSPLFHDGQRLPASYCNFYIANGCVLAPMFEDPADRQALTILADLFSDREVIGLPARDLVYGLGAFHCLTQQQPRVVS